MNGDLTGVQAGQVQELVQERFECVDARQDAIDAGLCVRLGRGVAERGAEQPERVERLPQIVAGRREEARFRQARLLGPLALGLRLLLLYLEGLDQREVFQAEPDAAADRPALQTGKGNQEGEVETERGREGQVLTSTEEGQTEDCGHQRQEQDRVDRRQVIRLSGDVAGRNQCDDHQERGDAQWARRIQEEDRRQAPAGPVRQDHPGVAASPHLRALFVPRIPGVSTEQRQPDRDHRQRQREPGQDEVGGDEPPHDGNQAKRHDHRGPPGASPLPVERLDAFLELTSVRPGFVSRMPAHRRPARR